MVTSTSSMQLSLTDDAFTCLINKQTVAGEHNQMADVMRYIMFL